MSRHFTLRAQSPALTPAVDVVKTRIQLRGSGEWAYPALLRLAREEGLSGMYKGECGWRGVGMGLC